MSSMATRRQWTFFSDRRVGGQLRQVDCRRRYIYRTGCGNGKRVQALGGAKNFAVVMPDADISNAVRALIGAGLRILRPTLHGDSAGGRGRRRNGRRRRDRTGRRDCLDARIGPGSDNNNDMQARS